MTNEAPPHQALMLLNSAIMTWVERLILVSTTIQLE